MTPRPLLGISCCTRQIGDENAQAVMTRYVAAAVAYAQADAVLIPAMPDLLDTPNLASRLDGILLTGSLSNIASAWQGAASGDGPFDRARDGTSFAMIEVMVKLGRPIFGVCRGMQEINVAFGGSLRADIGCATLAHHAPENVPFAAMFDHHHAVSLTEGGVLANALNTTSMIVNSVHYQGVATMADALTVEAQSQDGLVEALSGGISGATVLAVQWHPEWDADRNGDSLERFSSCLDRRCGALNRTN